MYKTSGYRMLIVTQAYGTGKPATILRGC